MRNIKKYAIILGTLLCCLLTACGNTETAEETSKEVTNQDAQVEEAADDSKEEKTETAVSDSTVGNEETIGDVDITGDITVDDCVEMVVGSDLVLDYSSFPEERQEAWNMIGRDDLVALFPRGEFITSQNNSNVAKSEKISVEVSIEPVMNNPSDMSGDVTLVDNEKYIVTKNMEFDAEEDDTFFYILYMIYDLENDAYMRESVVINKFDIEYANNFIDEYIPRFEEVLISNFQ